MVELLIPNQTVAGSIPVRVIFFFILSCLNGKNILGITSLHQENIEYTIKHS